MKEKKIDTYWETASWGEAICDMCHNDVQMVSGVRKQWKYSRMKGDEELLQTICPSCFDEVKKTQRTTPIDFIEQKIREFEHVPVNIISAGGFSIDRHEQIIFVSSALWQLKDLMEAGLAVYTAEQVKLEQGKKHINNLKNL